MQTMDFGLLRYANVGLSVVTNVLLWCGMLIMGEGYACVGAGSMQEISVPSLNFAVNLKLL